MPSVQYTVYKSSIQGSRHQTNDDAIFLNSTGGVFVLCDGVSEGGKGANAAQYVAENLPNQILKSQSKVDSSGAQEVKRLHLMQNELLDAFNLVQEGLKNHNKSKWGEDQVSATTALSLWINGAFGLLAHLGDSRAYLIRAGKVYQLTNDHKGFDELIRLGWEPESAKKHPMANALSKAMGGSLYSNPDLLKIEFQPKDLVVLLSDGAYQYLQKNWDQVLKVKSQADLDSMMKLASQETGDDASALLIQFESEFNPQSPVAASERVALIQKTPLCRYMDFPQKLQLAALCNVRVYEPGKTVIQEGTNGDTLFLVANGLLEVSKNSKYVSVVGAGQFVGEMGLIKKIKRTATVVAKQRSVLLTLESADLAEAFRKDKGLESSFYRSVTESLLDRILDQQPE